MLVWSVSRLTTDISAKGPIHFQRTVRAIVMQHRQGEEQGRKGIWPAMRKRAAGPAATKKLTEEEQCCKKLNSELCVSRELEW